MDNNNLNRIFAESDCISNKMMTDYLDGSLSSKDKNIVEVHLESCELCKDEFEGLKSMEDKNKLPEIVSILNRRVSKFSYRRRKIALFPQVSAMAAIVLLLVGFSWFFFYILNISPEGLGKKEMAQEFDKAKEKEEINKIIDDNKINPKTEIEIPISPTTKKTGKFENYKNSEDEIVTPIMEANKSNEITLSDDNIKDNREKIIAGNISSLDMVNNDEKEDLKKHQTKDSVEENLAYVSTGADKKLNRSKSKISERKGEQTTLSTFQLAMQEFENKNYKKAISLYLKVKEDKSINDQLFYYLGQSYQNIDNQNKATIYYDKVISIPGSKYYENALWYKSQLQIKADKKSDAIKNLNLLISNKSKFTNQAQQLIDSLKIK
jgi:hypothetical protein